MSITGWRVRMLWQNGPNGVSESYYWNNPDVDPTTNIYPAALNLMKARSLMMGTSVIPISFRISQLGAFRSYINSNPADLATMAVGPFLLTVSLNSQQVTAGISAAQDGSADQAASCVLANFYSGTAQHGRIFLSGVPDVLIRENPLGPWVVGVPSWLTAFNNWAALLTSPSLKWSFKARTSPTIAPWVPQAISSIALDGSGSGNWGVQTTTFAAPVAVGSTLQIRGFKMTSRAYVGFNGSWQVFRIDAGGVGGTNIYYLRNSSGVAGSQVAVVGTVQGVDYSLYPYRVITPGRETTHKRGNRSLASPGRRRTVARVS